ncbi:MAG: peptide ABC transporter substrate-binding protein [Parachlamydiales bacterium]|nr:peptide ABC transporter substrate-binding protein [Candidatus Acheromyda pituitae]
MENILKICFQKFPFTLDPQKSGDRTSSAIIFLLFKGLTRLEPDRRISLDLASSVHVLNNHTKYVFHLGNHYWSDGSQITAYDFERSWKRALSPGFSARAINFFYYLKNGEKAKQGKVSLDKVGVKAVSDFTLEVDLEFPCPYFLELTAFCPFFPVSQSSENNPNSPICSGGFFIQEQDLIKGYIRLKKNPVFRANSQISLDGILIKIISDEKEAFHQFEAGELDWMGSFLSPLPTNYLPSLMLSKKIKPVAGMTLCWFNTGEFPFSNLNVRKAFFHAIPRERLLGKLLLPDTLGTQRFCPPSSDEQHNPYSENYSEKKIKGFLKKAEKELGKTLDSITLTYESTAEFSRLAKFLKGYWEKMFKISVNLEPLTFREFWHRMPLQKFQISLGSTLTQYTDKIAFLEFFEHKNTCNNFSGWENLNYRTLLNKYRNAKDPSKRKKIGEKAEKVLEKSLPIAPIYIYHYTYLQKQYVKNLAISPIGLVHFDRIVLEKYQELPVHRFAVN